MNHIRPTFVSGRVRFDVAHRAERILVSILFASLAIVVKSEQDMAYASTIPGGLDLSGTTARSNFHPLVPPDLLTVFFFLYALERKITVGEEDQQHVPMPTGPASAFMMIQSQLFFQLLVALLNPVPLMKETNHFKGRHVLGHVAEEIPQFGLFVPMSSLNDQPAFFMEASLSVSLSRKDPSGYGLNQQRLALARDAEAKRQKRGLGKRPGSAKREKTGDLEIHETVIVKAQTLPAETRFKGHEDFTVQDIVLLPHNTLYRRERWKTPQGRDIVAPLSEGVSISGCHFGSSLQNSVLYQYHVR